MRTTNYNPEGIKMFGYNIHIPETDIVVFESLFEKYNIKVEPIQESYTPNKQTAKAIEKGLEEHQKGLLKGYTNAKAMMNDILSEDDE